LEDNWFRAADLVVTLSYVTISQLYFMLTASGNARRGQSEAARNYNTTLNIEVNRLFVMAVRAKFWRGK
jgi:hypothetical protein